MIVDHLSAAYPGTWLVMFNVINSKSRDFHKANRGYCTHSIGETYSSGVSKWVFQQKRLPTKTGCWFPTTGMDAAIAQERIWILLSLVVVRFAFSNKHGTRQMESVSSFFWIYNLSNTLTNTFWNNKKGTILLGSQYRFDTWYQHPCEKQLGTGVSVKGV